MMKVMSLIFVIFNLLLSCYCWMGLIQHHKYISLREPITMNSRNDKVISKITPASKSSVSNNVNTVRRKMGPPRSRKQLSNDPSSQIVGRVSVYCVGAGIDLEGLRAHVFRRGFSGGNSQSQQPLEDQHSQSLSLDSSPESVDLSNMMLTRSIANEADIDDEVLHISNSPLFMNLNLMGTKQVNAVSQQSSANIMKIARSGRNIWDPSSSISNEEEAQDQNEVHSDESEDEDDEAELIRRNKLLFMATQDIFYFDYGVVCFWGLSPVEEKAALTELTPFTIESVSPVELSDSYDTMEYIYDRKANPQRPIRFNRMNIRTLNIEEKLALSYGMAQSSKLFVLESRVLKSVEMTKYLPRELSIGGKIKSSKKELNKLIGRLFVEQTEVNLFSSILDTPDFLWENDEYLPSYQYIRSYLEVDDRVTLLNSRLGVIRELLDVLNAQVAHNNSERLEWIVIWLISVEIILGIFSNPLFVGKRFMYSISVPLAILLFRKLNWSG